MGATVAIVVVVAIGVVTFATSHTDYQASADLQSSKPRNGPSPDGPRASPKVERLAQNVSQARLLPTDSRADESRSDKAASPSAVKLPNSALDRPEPPMAASKQNADAPSPGRHKMNRSTGTAAHESPRAHRNHRLASRSQPGYAGRFEPMQPRSPQAAGSFGVPDNQANSQFSLFR